MKDRHMCRGRSQRDDLRKRRQGRHRPIGADRAQRSDLRCRPGDPVSDHDGGRQGHGVQADRALPLRGVRQATRIRCSPVLARQAQAAAYHAAEPGHLGVPDVPPGPRPGAHRRDRGATSRPVGGKAKAAEKKRKRKATRDRQSRAAQAGRGRPSGPRPGAEEGRQDQAPTAQAERRLARAGDLRRPRLPEVRVQELLARDGRLPAPARRRVTCGLSRWYSPRRRSSCWQWPRGRCSCTSALTGNAGGAGRSPAFTSAAGAARGLAAPGALGARHVHELKLFAPAGVERSESSHAPRNLEGHRWRWPGHPRRPRERRCDGHRDRDPGWPRSCLS